MTLRDKRQNEFAQKWLNIKFGILNLCPRFGKIYTTINILETYPENISVLIAYPEVSIKKSWQEDFKKRKYNNKNIVYTTHKSLNKHEDKIFDIVVIDEIHLLSEAQIETCKSLFMLNRTVIGLTGTLSEKTETNLYYELGIRTIAYYSLKQAIKEGVVSDYQITVITVKLDNKVKGMFKKPERTEYTQYRSLSWVIDNLQQGSMFLRLARLKIIKNSISKKNKTIELLTELKDERVLVFCGTIKIAESLGIPCYHSKSKDKTILEKFASGEGKQMAVINIGGAGVTYKPLNKVILSYFDSNSETLTQRVLRSMSMEYDNVDKKAHIYIITTNQKVENRWLEKALEFFDKSKIKYI